MHQHKNINKSPFCFVVFVPIFLPLFIFLQLLQLKHQLRVLLFQILTEHQTNMKIQCCQPMLKCQSSEDIERTKIREKNWYRMDHMGKFE